MTSPAEQIEIDCPKCHTQFKTWHKASINLQLDDFSKRDIQKMTTALCPECKQRISLDCLVVGRDGVWTIGPTNPAMDEITQILSRIESKVAFKYPGATKTDTEKHGVLKDRSVCESTNAPGSVPYWDVVDLIEFAGEPEPKWIRIGYYRKPGKTLNWGSQTTITEPISIWKRILVKAAREKKWFRDLLNDVMDELEKPPDNQTTPH